VTDWVTGCWRDAPLAQRVRASATLLLVACLGFGCAGPGAGVAPSPAGPVEPTPWVEGTLRAAIGAAVSAASTPAPPTPTTLVVARGTVAPVVAAGPTAAPVPAIRATPSASPAAAQVTRVEAVDFNAYRLENEWTFIQGFTQNNGSATAVSIEVVVSLLADGDATVASTHAHIKPDMLRPGSRSPWLAQVRGAPNFKRVRVRVEARPLTDVWLSTVTQDFRLEGVTARSPADQVTPPSITGEVINVGDKPVTEVEVTAAIYDQDHALIQVARALVKAHEIAPGERAPFEIRPLGRGLKEIPRYELFVEGRPRT
jgi:hypothetical protein